MIPGHEEITIALNDQELELVPFIEKGLRYHVGVENSISAQQIRKAIKNKKGVTVSGPRLRKILHHIRTYPGAMLICANGKGYYLAKTEKEFDIYMRSLNERIKAITHLRDSMKANAKNKAIKQAQKHDPFEGV